MMNLTIPIKYLISIIQMNILIELQMMKLKTNSKTI